MKQEKITKIKLKDLKNNPYHTGEFDKKQIKKLEASIKTLGILRSFSVFKKGEDYCLVCGHHTREAAINVLGKNKEVEITVQVYDDDTAVWGMAVENFTQDGNIKRKIDDLVNLRTYLKKTFKNPKEFTDFINKRKGVSVVTHDKNSKRGRLNEGRPNGHEIGSSRNIEEWINRDEDGIIMEFHLINDYLRIHDNLDPVLYDKMVVGEPNKKPKNEKEEEKENEKKDVFNLTNANILSKLGNDYKEQNDVLNALQNSLGERMHRVRSRDKVVKKYRNLKKLLETGKIKVKVGKEPDKKGGIKTKYEEKELTEKDKKEIKKNIELIRKGKKDIGNISLPNIELPQSMIDVTIREYTHELQDKFRILGNEMEIYSKEKLSQNTSQQLESWLMYLQSWGNHKFADFFKAVVKEAAKKRVKGEEENKNENVVEFKFGKDIMNGGEN